MENKKSVKPRIIISLIAVVAYGLLNHFINIAAPIVSGQLAVQQLKDSDVSYGSSQFGLRFLSGSPWPILALVVILLIIW
jgi:hypothetical protein